MSLTPKQQKKLAKVKELEDDSVLTVANDLVELEEKIESEVESLKEIVLQVEAQKGDVGERGEKGDTGEKGDKGDVGAKGDKGDKGDSGKDGKDGLNGKDGRDGKDGKDGIDGKNGKDGEPDKKTKKLVVGLEKDVKTIKDYDIPTLQNRTQLLNQMISGLSRDLESQDTLQEVTNNGSATTNDITVNSVTETVPTLLKLNQTTPQTFTAGTVTGTGLLKVTSGTLGLDTTTYLDTTTAATTYAKLDGTNHPFTYVITPKIYPSADSTTALQILKADGTTSMMTFDTTNGQVGVGMTPQGASFQIRGATTANNYTQIWGASGASGNLSTLALIKTADASGDFVFSSFIAGGALSGAPKIHFGGYDATPINGAKITMDIANGRLGIGITSPTSPIHISTTVTTPMNIVSSDTNTVLIRSTKGANAATAQVQLQTVNRSMVFASTDQASGVAGWYDGTAGVWRMAIIHTSGNVDIGGGIATSYKLNVAGTTASTLFLSGNGTVGGPAFSFKGDTNTGMYNVSADVLGFTTAGSTRMQIGATGEIAVGTSPSAGIPFRVIKSTTQLTGAQTNIYVDGVHTLNANNAFQIRGVYSGPAINQAGFNATASISSGGAVPSFYALPQATGASGTVTNVTGFFSSARNTGAGIVSELIGFSAGAGLNTGGGSVTNVYGFYAGANTVGTNNYEFYGTTVASSGRWGFYQAGGAQNYMAGNLGLGVAPSEALEVKDAGNIKFQTTTGTKIGTATGQKIGFWNATPVIQQVTNAYTSDGEGSAYTGIDNLQVGTPYAQVSDLNQLRVAYETLRSSYDDLLTKLKTTGVVA